MLRGIVARSSVPLAALAALSFAACSVSVDDTASNGKERVVGSTATAEDAEEGQVALTATVDDLSEEQMQRVDLLRVAIDKGLKLGKQTLAEQLGVTLQEKGVSGGYTCSLVQGTGTPQPAATECPFVAPGDGTSLDCRSMVKDAVKSAYARMENVQQSNPLDSRFDALKQDAAHHYGEGMFSGIDNEAVSAIYTLRQQKRCDQQPRPVQSAYEAGVEAGRALYIDKLNERLLEAGMSMHYPDSIQQITQCRADFSLLEPARQRAVDASEDYADEHPLCPAYQPQTADDMANLDKVESEFAKGFAEGVATEHSLAAERIFRVVPCNTGDPIVLDVNGDGVSLQSLESSTASFDMFGSGQAVKVSWIQGDDALLVLDRNGNGTIDSGRELFGNFVGDRGFNEVPTGFDHLAMYDSQAMGGNADGRIDAQDAVFAELQLWQDQNGDGVSQAHELHALPDLGVQAVGLVHEGNSSDPNLSHRGTFVRTAEAAAHFGASEGQAYDAWFRHARARLFR